MSLMSPVFPARLSSQPEGLRRRAWDGGAFTTAYRPATPMVEGEILSSNHLIMVTLEGGASRHEIMTADGHRYDGPDRPGSVSFLPSGCLRKLRLHRVHWRWATIAIGAHRLPELAGLAPFSGIEDGFLRGMLSEFDRLDVLDGGIDPAWRECMLSALVAYLHRRHERPQSHTSKRLPLPPRKLRRVMEYIDAQLSGELRIADLATLCDMSEGHFHRAFRAATGHTPLQHLTRRRIDAAQQLLAKTDLSIGVIAFKVGFVSASHFARTFQHATAKTPREFRHAFRVG